MSRYFGVTVFGFVLAVRRGSGRRDMMMMRDVPAAPSALLITRPMPVAPPVMMFLPWA